MAVLLPTGDDAPPAQLLDRDERLVDVPVLGHEVRPEVQREAFGVQHMWGRLCEVCARRGWTCLVGRVRGTYGRLCS